jgi:hypothetical protein
VPAAAARDVRAVPVVVDGAVGVGEVRRGDDLVADVGVCLVDARVEHRDRGAGAVVAGGPRLRGAGLRDALLQPHLDLAVQPDGPQVAGGRDAHATGGDLVGHGGELVAQQVRVGVLHRAGEAVHAVELPVHRDRLGPDRGGARGALTGGPGARHDHGDPVRGGVVEALLHQRRDVEQLAVEGGADQRRDLVRDHVVVLAGLDRLERPVPVRRDGRDAPALAERPPTDDVAGDECHLVGLAPLSLARGRRRTSARALTCRPDAGRGHEHRRHERPRRQHRDHDPGVPGLCMQPRCCHWSSSW